jgi:hypothetical protein
MAALSTLAIWEGTDVASLWRVLAMMHPSRLHYLTALSRSTEFASIFVSGDLPKQHSNPMMA